MSTAHLEDRILKLENGQKALTEQFVSLIMQFGELQKGVNQEQVRQWAVGAVDSRQAEVSKLTSDCTKVLNFLCEQGLVNRAQLNEALR